MKLLVALLLVASVAGLIAWTFYQQRQTTDAERAELDNLRAFKAAVRDHALAQTGADPTDPFARVLLDEVHLVERANASPSKD